MSHNQSDSPERTYSVFDFRGRHKLDEVKGIDLSDAAEQIEHLWPCQLRAPHLPYRYVEVEKDGTLSFPSAASRKSRARKPRKSKYHRSQRR